MIPKQIPPSPGCLCKRLVQHDGEFGPLSASWQCTLWTPAGTFTMKGPLITENGEPPELTTLMRLCAEQDFLWYIHPAHAA